MDETDIFNELMKNRGKKRQIDVANHLGVQPPRITEWKNGKRKRSLEKLHKIAKFLGLEINIKIQKKSP